MKYLTDYFKSSFNNVSPECSKKAVNNQGKVSPNTPKSKNNNKRKTTPRGRNKISPRTSPKEGYNLLFNIVRIESLNKEASNLNMEKDSATKEMTSNHLDNDNSIVIQDTPESASPKNAFQLLMMSRHKVIGSNSPGKERSEQEDKSSPPKLSERKRLLQNWSNSISAKKRKLDDDEIDKCIKIKLNTRKKRLKTLLHIDDDSVDVPESIKKTNYSKIMKETKKEAPSKPNKIDTVKENPEENKTSYNGGNDFVTEVAEVNTPKSSRSRKHKKKSKNTPKLPSTPKSSWKMKIKLGNQSPDEISSSNGNKDNDIIILDEKSVNTVKEVVTEIESSSENSNVESVVLTETNGNETNKAISKSEETDGVIHISEESDEVTQITEEIPEIETPNGHRRVLRNRTTLNKNKITDYAYSSDDSDDEVKKKNNKKALKVAPVFAKAIPKPKIDPEILEARRKFLMSDMPDVLKKKIEKQVSNGLIADIEFDVFPKISHVYQKESNNPLWNLPSPNLKLRITSPIHYKSSDLLSQFLIGRNVIKHLRYDESEPIKNTKIIMRDMKLKNVNYPVYKAFRLLSEKNSTSTKQASTKTTPKRGRKPRKSSEKVEKTPKIIEPQNDPKFQMWTEKYKPRGSEDFFGNSQAVSSLKKWLEKWREVLESGKKRRKYSSDSESEFMSSDAESIYDCSLSTTVVLTGPYGSGKSSSVYAVSNELGLNVLELNASSRRTGKHILQELQEATQSHQVRKKNSLDSFTNKGSSSKPAKDVEKTKSKKMCVLLIEDIDVVFEQDDGFINAISQITATSKRPIVITTTNEKSVYTQKFTNDFKTIRFNSLSVKYMGIWLQILCLLEGIFVDLSSIGELLEYNRGDIRKTLLELQFWIQSGGQMNKRKTLSDPIFDVEGLQECNSFPIFDDTSNIALKEYDEKLEDYRVHSNILSDFETFQLDQFYNVPLEVNLKTLWWNIPKFLDPIKPKPETLKPKSKSRTRKRLKMISDMYDVMAYSDVLYRQIGFKTDDPVCKKRWHCGLQDSLELEERSSGYIVKENILELNHYLMDSHLDKCKRKFIYEFSENQRLCNMAVPSLDDERKLENNHKYEEELMKPVPCLYSLDRKSVVLDYLPCLRSIARTENTRCKNNMKRRNRFHNYLQNFNITCDTPILDFATQTFSTIDSE